MMDEDHGVSNRRNRRKAGANKRKDERRLLLDGEEPDEQSYLSVTSADIRNWLRSLSGAPRSFRRATSSQHHYHAADTYS